MTVSRPVLHVLYPIFLEMVLMLPKTSMPTTSVIFHPQPFPDPSVEALWSGEVTMMFAARRLLDSVTRAERMS